MKKRLLYLALFLLLLLVEVCIALFMRDRFIRPYLGDVLVTVLLCCLLRVLFPEGFPYLPLAVMLFSWMVEGSQALHLAQRLDLVGTPLGVILGSVFDWFDLLCYTIGCAAFWCAEALFRKRGTEKSPEARKHW